MQKITKEDIFRLVQMSNIKITEDEIEPLIDNISEVLDYAERVTKFATQAIEEESNKNINVFREDIIIKTNPEPILVEAPEREADYFVVPKILEQG